MTFKISWRCKRNFGGAGRKAHLFIRMIMGFSRCGPGLRRSTAEKRVYSFLCSLHMLKVSKSVLETNKKAIVILI